jgi:glycosyltransferase involved in cell wall biosynthesis
MNTALPLLSVVVPCYRDELNIPELIRRLRDVLNRVHPNYEIIYVNDCSPDNSAEVLNRLAQQSPEITVIHHSRNFGKMGAIDSGFRQALGQYVVFMDGDLQDPPELIEQFLEKRKQGFLVVFGRAINRKDPVHIVFMRNCFYWIWTKIANFKLPQNAGDFCLLDRSVVDIVNAFPEKDRFFRGLRAWVGFPQTAVEFERPERFAGTSTQSLFSYFGWASAAITSFSYWPLRMISFLALGSVGLLFFFMATILILALTGSPVPRGYVSMSGLVIFSGTLNLICLAVISEYLMRLFIEMKKRPSFVVKDIVNDHHQKH